MVDSFDGLRHDIVVGGYDDDTEVSYLGSSGTHCGERLVARSVEECDVTAVGELHVISTDVLE